MKIATMSLPGYMLGGGSVVLEGGGDSGDGSRGRSGGVGGDGVDVVMKG